MRKETVYMLITVLLFVILLGMVLSCSTNTRTEQTEETKKESIKEKETTSKTEELKEKTSSEKHYIDFALEINDRNINIIGNTNIPDDSFLNISVDRYVKYTDMEEKRVVTLHDGEITVKDGKFDYSTVLSDKEWYEKDKEENKMLGIDFEKIFDDCYVLVTFTPANNSQPAKIYEILGNNFENLNVETVGNFKSIQVKKEFKFPLEEGLLGN